MPTIVQLTDTHLTAEDQSPDAAAAWGNFRWALERACALEPDLLILSGDLTRDHGDATTYTRVATALNALPFDSIILPGNHDDPTLFAAAFGRRYRRAVAGGTLDGIVDLEGLPMVVVDTSAGVLTAAQVDWLDATLFDAAERYRRYGVPPIVWMHHPPRVGLHCFMDRRYPLRNHQLVWDSLRAAAVPLWVFCGHYHMSREVVVDSVRLHLTPAVYRQYDPTTVDLHICSYEPAFRVVHVDQTHRDFLRRVESVVIHRTTDKSNEE